jgi:hypothetical protein
MGSAFSDAPPPPPIHRLIKDFLASLRHRFHPPPVPSSNPMSRLLPSSLAAVALLTALPACRTTPPPATSSSPTINVPFDPVALRFTHPGTGDLFQLHLGEFLHPDSPGITKVPAAAPKGTRDATSSYYQPVHRVTSALAESVFTSSDRQTPRRRPTIQYQPDGQHLLITENVSDGLPVRRFILYTVTPSRHYSIRYLAPNNPVAPGINRAIIPDLRLLPGNRIDYFGQPIPIDKFPSSPLPFSVGH